MKSKRKDDKDPSTAPDLPVASLAGEEGSWGGFGNLGRASRGLRLSSRPRVKRLQGKGHWGLGFGVERSRAFGRGFMQRLGHNDFWIKG